MIQVYTGEGKGKTTAALGLALRAAGAGLKIYIGQFIKGKKYNEYKSLDKIKNIKIECLGSGCFIKSRPKQKDIEFAQKALKKIKKIISAKKYDLVILDEINVAVHLNLIDLRDVLGLINKTPEKTELILTGRYADKALINAADLVSDVREIKHYYKNGVKARCGIEY